MITWEEQDQADREKLLSLLWSSFCSKIARLFPTWTPCWIRCIVEHDECGIAKTLDRLELRAILALTGGHRMPLLPNFVLWMVEVAGRQVVLACCATVKINTIWQPNI